MADEPTVRNEVSIETADAVVQAGTIQQVSLASAGVSAGRTPRPRQLPPDISHFTGRSAELDTLNALLDDTDPSATSRSGTAVVIFVIAGAGGMGKTALAVHWAHQVCHQFPDGQLYVNLRGYDPYPPVSPRQALDGFLRALGMTGATIPPDLDDMAASYRSLLADRRMLVVLDNAATSEQVRPLLPNTPSCMVVVTSRSRLSGLIARNGARRITLDQLTPVDAVKLLRQIIGATRIDAEPTAASDLANCCACLPLALRIMADRIADRPHSLSLADLVTDLGDEQHRLDVLAAEDDDTTAVRTVFSWSYQALAPDTARVFRLLALHPGATISTPAAAAIAESTAGDVRRHLNALTSVHLLTEIDRDRYQFHDLIREYATEQATTDETLANRVNATRRVIAWYVLTGHRADFLLYPDRGARVPAGIKVEVEPLVLASRDDALNWYNAEHNNILLAIQHAALHGHHDLAVHLPSTLDTYLVLRARWSDKLAAHEIGLASAQQIRDRALELNELAIFGEAQFDAGLWKECMLSYQRVLIQARASDNRRIEAGAFHMFGVVLAKTGHLDAAADNYQRALPIYQEIGNARGEALMLGLLGDVRRRQQRFDEALDYTRQSLVILRTTSNRWNEALLLRQLGQIHTDANRLEEAVTHFRDAVMIYRELDDRYETAQTLHLLGEALDTSGHFDQANHAWTDSLALYEELNAPQAEELRARLTR